jgi:hypothetical protein
MINSTIVLNDHKPKEIKERFETQVVFILERNPDQGLVQVKHQKFLKEDEDQISQFEVIIG